MSTGITTALALAGATYSSWLLEFVLNVGLDPADSFLSELDAVGRPYRGVFSVADMITGLLVVVAATAAVLTLRRRRLSTTGWIALAVFGGATIADAALPIGCIPTPDHPCGGSPGGLFPQLHHIHALTSTVAVNAIFVAMIAFTVAAYRYRRWPWLRTAGLAILITCSIATAWMLIADNLPGDYELGVAQRIQVGAMSLWLVTLGVTQYRERFSSPTAR